MKITPLGFAKAHGPNTSSPQFSTTHRDALALQQPQRDALSRVLPRALLLRLPALHGLSLPVHAGYARRGPGPNACWSWIPPPPSPSVRTCAGAAPTLPGRAPAAAALRGAVGGVRRYRTREYVSGPPREIEAVFALRDNPLRVACVEAL